MKGKWDMIREGTDIHTRKDMQIKKSKEAEERKEFRGLQGPTRQLAVLDARLGKGQGAWKERHRLTQLIDVSEAQ